MSDRRDGQSRRGGDRSYYDNKDRRRDRDDTRDRGDSRRHDGARDYGREDRERDRDHRRYRSRSRDRGDRRRSRSPGRERGHDRRDADRHRDRDRDRGHRREDDRAEPPRERGDRSVRGEPGRLERDKPSRDTNRDRDGRPTTESPRRSASPRRVFERDTDEHTLPTRSKPSSTAPTPAPPVSFKVKGRDSSHGPEPLQQSTSTRENSQEQQQQGNHDDGDRRPSRGRFDAEPMDEDEVEDVVVEDDGLDDMAAMMGFGGFGTTKGKHVLGNNVGAARKEKKTEYRQYMNRVGGFDRPLSPTR